MTDIHLLVDLHINQKRQGPCGDAETEKALDLAGVDRTAPLNIADIGCGTGASTLLLARLLDARITAVDFLPAFLEVLEARAGQTDLSGKITTLACSMDSLPFEDEEYDVIWSEGAIYNIGFERGVKNWNRYLKPEGLLVVSEITWTTSMRPSEIQNHWESEYPEIDTASSKIRILERNGYSPIGYFVLPDYCWLDNYYLPLQNAFGSFLDRHHNSEAAQSVVDEEIREIELYEKYKDYYGYGVYVARKR